MLKFFESDKSCHVLLDPPLTQSDAEALDNLFKCNYLSWYVEFGRIYYIDVDILNMLYREIFQNSKNILIKTHKSKLNRYLHKLGFNTTFESLIKEDVVQINDIKIILIGGSADSSNKVIDIVQNTDLDNLTLVVIQHVEANRVGIFDEILQKKTKQRVSYAKDGERVKSAHIYLAPSDKHLKVQNGRFLLDDGERYNYSKPSVSLGYESFSAYYKEQLLVIQECGYASDGVDKLEFLKKNGSKLIIQDIDECEAKPMVKNALNLNTYNYVLDIKSIIEYINLIGKKNQQRWMGGVSSEYGL